MHPPVPQVPPSKVILGHVDYDVLSAIAKEISKRTPGGVQDALPDLVMDAVEFVLDPVRTGRTKMTQLDNVEKTFIGLKVEHFIRDLLDAPKGVRDLILAGHDVDVKNTVRESWSWMIPPETYRNSEPCLLIAVSEKQRKVWMGLIIAKAGYLGSKNRDAKCRILSPSYPNILWLVDGADWPRDRWAGIDMGRFRDLRRMKGGTKRATKFFSENLRRPTHRSIVLSLLHDQKDPMKRLRGNSGAKDKLKPKGIALLSGLYFRDVLERLGFPNVENDEFISIRPISVAETNILQRINAID
jgi:hypothetical protein